MIATDRAEQVRKFASVIADPVLFARAVLGHDPWQRSEQILRAIAKPRALVAVKACHSSSKSLALDTPIPTPDGWATMGTLRIGDMVFDEEGESRPITTLSPIQRRECYRVTFDTGESIVASEDHLWSVVDLQHRPRTWAPGNGARHKVTRVEDWRDHWSATKDLTTWELLTGLRDGGQFRWRIPLARGISGGEWPLAVEPYTFGAWLGDGSTARAELTCGEEDLPHFEERIGGKVVRSQTRAPRLIFGARTYLDCPAREIGGSKRIPVTVLRADRTSRLEVLRGLMDTDGWAATGSSVSISQVSCSLAEDIRALVVSLGYKPAWREQRAVLNGVDCGPCYVISFAPDECPFSLPRKVERWNKPAGHASRSTSRTITAIEYVGEREVRCLGIDSPRHLYLAGDGMVPTHNTFTAAEAVLWFLVRYPDGKVVTTAPTMQQVKELLWREIHLARNGARIAIPDPDKVQLDISPDRFALGRASSEGVNFQGFHGRVLIIIDEAPGVDNIDVWSAIEGIRAGGDVRVLALGNPTIASGPFYELFNEQREAWELITISAFDTPNLAGISLEALLAMDEDELDRNERPYLTTRRWVRERHDEWGPGHPDWQSRVLGQFPDQSSNALISLAWLDAAAEREPAVAETPPTKPTLRVGIDVAGPGEDETVVCVRDGPNVVMLRGYADSDPRGAVVSDLAPYREQIERINVDSAGIGWGFYLHLRDLKYPVTPVNVGESPRDREKFANLKAELYWGLRQRFAAGDIAGLTDKRTRAQLAGILWSLNARGQTMIERKEDARKRGVKSPDRAEALMLAFAESSPGFLAWARKDMERLATEKAESPTS